MIRISLVSMLLVPFLHAAEPRAMTLEDLWKIKRLGAPAMSPNGLWVAVDVTSYDMEKDDSTSQIWLLSTDGKKQTQLTNAGTKNTGPVWSPDGKSIAFLSKRGTDENSQIYVISPDGGDARKVTDMAMSPGGIKWSVEGKTIYTVASTWPDTHDNASHKKREKEQKESKSKAVVIDAAVYRYWDHWLTDGKKPYVFSVNVETGKHTNILVGSGRHLPVTSSSINDFDVSPDDKELCFVSDSADPKGNDYNNDLFTFDLNDPHSKPTNITPNNAAADLHPVYSPDGKHLAFVRQTIKYFYADRQRLMIMNRASREVKEITADLDRSVVNPKWMPDNKRLCFECDDAGYSNIYFVDIDEAKPKTFPTPSFSEHAMSPAVTVRRAAFLRSNFSLPGVVMVHGPGQPERQISFFNEDLLKAWKLGKVGIKRFKGADDEEVPMWIVFPPDFDANKKWPLVQFIHGGPHNGIMSDFSFRWNLQLWAAKGYVVGCVNFHGSSGFGQKFAFSITGDYGTKPMTDIMKATDWFESQPWIDKNRMAAAGGSYGGYMVAYLNGHTDRFKAMVCHAGVYSYHGQMASDIVRGRERSLGAFPWKDLEKVDKQSAQRYSANFKTPTIILHGEKDYRVPITQGMEYYNTLKQKGVDTRFVYFPDENHWILKPQNSRLWHKEVFAWLEKYIGSGPTR